MPIAAGAIHLFFFLLVVTVLWLGPSFLVASFAQRKGRSFALFLIASLLISWLLALLVALVLPARDKGV
jgi:hypothetical protein